MLAISVDPQERSKRVVEQNGLGFPVLCDAQHEVIEAYGLLHEGGGPGGSDIAVPAHVLIDRDGRIVWRFISRRITDRLTPEDILATVTKLVE